MQLDGSEVVAALSGRALTLDSLADMYRSVGWSWGVRGITEDTAVINNPYGEYILEGVRDYARFVRGELATVPEYVLPRDVLGNL